MATRGKGLSEEVRCAILADYLDGEKVEVISAKYGVSTSYATVTAKRAGFSLRDMSKSGRMKLVLKKKQKLRVSRDWLFVATRIPNAKVRRASRKDHPKPLPKRHGMAPEPLQLRHQRDHSEPSQEVRQPDKE